MEILQKMLMLFLIGLWFISMALIIYGDYLEKKERQAHPERFKNFFRMRPSHDPVLTIPYIKDEEDNPLHEWVDK